MTPTCEYEIFGENCRPTVSDGERVYQIHTSNPSDVLYIVRPADSRYNVITDDEFEEGVRFRLRAKYGKAGWYMLDRLEDVTDEFYGSDAE